VRTAESLDLAVEFAQGLRQDLPRVPRQGLPLGPRRGLPPVLRRAAFSTVPVEPPDLSREARRLPADTLHPEVKREPARVLSATKATAERPGVIRRGEAPASAVAEERAAVAVGTVVAGTVNRSDFNALGDPEIQK